MMSHIIIQRSYSNITFHLLIIKNINSTIINEKLAERLNAFEYMIFVYVVAWFLRFLDYFKCTQVEYWYTVVSSRAAEFPHYT